MGYKIHIYSSVIQSWKLSMDRKLLSEFEYFCKGRSIYCNDTLVLPGKDFLLSYDTEVLFLTIQFKIKINQSNQPGW